MKICPTCGRTFDDSANVCTNCGSALNAANQQGYYNANPNFQDAQQNFQNAQQNFQQGYQNASQGINQAFQGMGYNPNPGNITPRNIVMAIIFSFITCGIYGIYWLVKLNDEINQLSGEPNGTSGVMVVILTIVTCGIYGLYWNYKMGERYDRMNGTLNGSSNILFLVLAIFELSIVNYCLMQDAINKRVS